MGLRLWIPDSKLEPVWEEVKRQLDLPETEKTREMLRQMLTALELFSRKQHDYSSVNVMVCGEEGIFTRITDKWARLFSHYRLRRELRNESVDDTWFDLAVYSMMALLMRRGQWRLSEEEQTALGIAPPAPVSPWDVCTQEGA